MYLYNNICAGTRYITCSLACKHLIPAPQVTTSTSACIFPNTVLNSSDKSSPNPFLRSERTHRQRHRYSFISPTNLTQIPQILPSKSSPLLPAQPPQNAKIPELSFLSCELRAVRGAPHVTYCYQPFLPNPNPDISAVGTDCTVHHTPLSIPFIPCPLFLCSLHGHAHPQPWRLPISRTSLPLSVPSRLLCSLHGYPFSTCTQPTTYLNFSSSLYLTYRSVHRPLPFALRVEVGRSMHVQYSTGRAMSCIDLVSAPHEPSKLRKVGDSSLSCFYE